MYSGHSAFDFDNNLNDELLDNRWHMLTIVTSTINASSGTYRQSVFIDGILEEQKENSILRFVGNTPMLIGNGFDGQLDNVRIYNVPLTPDQIGIIYDSENAEEDTGPELVNVSKHLMNYYNFDDQDGRDVMGNSDGAVSPSVTFVNSSPNGGGHSASFPAGGIGAMSVDKSYLGKINSFTICFWFKSSTGNSAPIISQGSRDENRNSIGIYSGVVYSGHDAWPLSGNISTTLYDGNWHFITITNARVNPPSGSSNNQVLYVDGFLVRSESNSILNFDGGAFLQIGSNSRGTFLNGELDNIRFYNRALSNSDVNNIFISER